MSLSVYHQEDGLIFRKVQADTGISYIAVPLDEVQSGKSGLLVRHGNPATGQCGYYPLNLIGSSPDHRWYAAQRNNKRPPTEEWISKMKTALEEAGVTFH